MMLTRGKYELAQSVDETRSQLPAMWRAVKQRNPFLIAYRALGVTRQLWPGSKRFAAQQVKSQGSAKSKLLWAIGLTAACGVIWRFWRARRMEL